MPTDGGDAAAGGSVGPQDVSLTEGSKKKVGFVLPAAGSRPRSPEELATAGGVVVGAGAAASSTSAAAAAAAGAGAEMAGEGASPAESGQSWTGKVFGRRGGGIFGGGPGKDEVTKFEAPEPSPIKGFVEPVEKEMKNPYLGMEKDKDRKAMSLSQRIVASQGSRPNRMKQPAYEMADQDEGSKARREEYKPKEQFEVAAFGVANLAPPDASDGVLVKAGRRTRGSADTKWYAHEPEVQVNAVGDIYVDQSELNIDSDCDPEGNPLAKKDRKRGAGSGDMTNFRRRLAEAEAKKAEEERRKAADSAPKFVRWTEWKQKKRGDYKQMVQSFTGQGGGDMMDKLKDEELPFEEIRQMIAKIGGKKDRFVMRFVADEAQKAKFQGKQGSWVGGWKFQGMAGMLVTLQIFFIGYATDFISYGEPVSGRMVWALIDVCVVLPFFLFEFYQRFNAMGFAYFDSFGHDFFFLFVGLLEAAYPLWVGGEALKMTKIIQLGRVVNLVRFRDVVNQSPKLKAIVDKGTGAFDFVTVFKAAMWCLLLITLMTYMWTLLVTSTLAQGVEVSLEYKKMSGTDIRQYFGHVVWGFNSFLGLMSLEHAVVDRMSRATAEAHGMGIMIIFLLFIAFARFGMLNVLVAQIVTKAIITSQEQREYNDEVQDKELQIALAKLGQIFRALDADDSGTISRPELMEVVELDQIEYPDITELFDVLGQSQGEGEEPELGVEEFIGACMRLKGDAKAKDSFIVQLSVIQLTEKIEYLGETSVKGLRYVENACGLVDRMDVFLKRFYRVVPHRPGVEKNLSSEEKFYVMPGFSAREPLGVPYGFVKLAAGKSRGYDPRNGFMPNKEELLRLGGSNAEFLQTRAVKMRKKKKGSTTGGGAAGSAGSPEKAGDMEVSGEFGSGKAALTSGI